MADTHVFWHQAPAEGKGEGSVPSPQSGKDVPRVGSAMPATSPLQLPTAAIVAPAAATVPQVPVAVPQVSVTPTAATMVAATGIPAPEVSETKNAIVDFYGDRPVSILHLETVRSIKIMYIDHPWLNAKMPITAIGAETFAEWLVLLKRQVSGKIIDDQIFGAIRHVMPPALAFFGSKTGLRLQGFGEVIEMQASAYRDQIGVFRKENENWIEQHLSTSTKLLFMIGHSVMITHAINVQLEQAGAPPLGGVGRPGAGLAGVREEQAPPPVASPSPEVSAAPTGGAPSGGTAAPPVAGAGASPERPFSLFGGRAVDGSGAAAQQ